MKFTRVFKTVQMMFLLLGFMLLVVACDQNNNPEGTGDKEPIHSLISDGVKWQDVSYVYAQENGNNPLALVAYDKGGVENPILSKK